VSQEIIAILIVVGYFLLLGFAVLKWGKMKDQSIEEFAVAGRSFKWYWVMFTILATWFTGSFYTGNFGWGVTQGIIAQYAMIYTTGGLLIYYVIGPRTWVWGKKHNLMNLPDFIELRYGSKAYAIVVAVIGLLLNIPWHVMAFKTFGYVANALTGGAIPFNVGMVAITVIVLAYVLWGGQRSVVTTDFIQGIICCVVVVGGCIAVAYKLFGGFGPMFARLAVEKPELLTVPAPSGYWASIIIAGTLGAYCWLEVFNRIFVSDSVKTVRKVALGAPIIALLCGAAVLMLSLGAALVPGIDDPQGGFFALFKMVGGAPMLAFAAVIVIAGEMSSIDSQLATNGVVFARNIVGKLRGSDLDGKKMVLVSRIACAVMVAVGLVVAMMDLPALQLIAIWTFEHLVHLFPAIVLGLLWKRGNLVSAVAGMAVGMPITIILQVLGSTPAGWSQGVIGLAANIVIYVAVALIRKPDARTEELFAEVERVANN
jgi:SSS family solute:Na+ symporter